MKMRQEYSHQGTIQQPSGCGDTTVYYDQWPPYGVQFKVYSLQFTVYGLQFRFCSLRLTVYSLQFIDYSLQFTVYSAFVQV